MRTKSHGFTLLEVLVALALFATAAAVLFEAMADGVHAAGRSADDTRAVLVAQSILAEVSGDPAYQPAGGETNQGYRWEVSFAPYVSDVIAEGSAVLREVTVSVRAPAASREIRLTRLVVAIPD